jgi:hypothetical protein
MRRFLYSERTEDARSATWNGKPVTRWAFSCGADVIDSDFPPGWNKDTEKKAASTL